MYIEIIQNKRVDRYEEGKESFLNSLFKSGGTNSGYFKIEKESILFFSPADLLLFSLDKTGIDTTKNHTFYGTI